MALVVAVAAVDLPAMLLDSEPGVQHVAVSDACTEEAVYAIAEGLRQNTSLVSLVMRGKKVLAPGARALASALQTNRTLRSLNLASNTVGDEGAHALADALEVNGTLEELNLLGNRIGDDGARSLARSLLRNRSLRELSLSSNLISLRGTLSLQLAAERNTSLFALDIGRHARSDADFVASLTAIQTYMERNRLGLAELHVSAPAPAPRAWKVVSVRPWSRRRDEAGGVRVRVDRFEDILLLALERARRRGTDYAQVESAPVNALGLCDVHGVDVTEWDEVADVGDLLLVRAVSANGGRAA